MYRFGLLIFVAFIRYAKGHISFRNWHISPYGNFLGLGLGQGPKHPLCMNSGSSSSWLSFDTPKGVRTFRIGIYFYANIFWGWGWGLGLSLRHLCTDSDSSSSWLSFDTLKGTYPPGIGVYLHVNIFWGWGWGLSLSPGHLFLYGFEFFIFAAFIQYAERHVSFKSDMGPA